METFGVPVWEAFGSALLQYHAGQRRLNGLPPRDFAGLVIDDAEVDRLLSQLPGLDGPDPRQSSPGVERLMPQLEERRRQLHAVAGEDNDDPFFSIVRSATIAGPVLETFAILASIEFSPQKQRLLAYLQDNVSATRPWLSTLDELLGADHTGSRTVARDAAMSRAELIYVEGSAAWGARAVSLHERVTWAIAGERSPDAGLPKGHRIIVNPPSPRPSPEVQHVTVVTGADRQSRLIHAIEKTPGESFLVVPEPAGDAEWKSVIREATVSAYSVVVEVAAELRSETAYWLDRAAHLSFAISTAEEQPLERMPRRKWKEFHVDAGLATDEDWRKAVNSAPGPEHRLNREQLALVARAHAAQSDDETDIGAAVRRLASGHLDRLALQVRPSRNWDDLVLPQRETDQLRELTERYRHGPTVYGKWGFKAQPSSGIVALFAGASGTGKTLAAEVIAADLGLDVYKIDLSSVVSKYIGETEKNLERIFDAASTGNMVLFFDEADSLFGKRSDVSDAHDRYANIEVSYLLQRLETYEGLVVLATNLQGNIDQAFMRRIHVAVDFPMPSEDERLRIWQHSFPSGAPLGSVDFPFLAEHFRISGGNIRNATLTAAFMAAARDTDITMRDVVRGLERELEKLGRMITQEDFGQYHALLKA